MKAVAEKLRGLEVGQQDGENVSRLFQDLPHWAASHGYSDPAFPPPAVQDDSGSPSTDGTTILAESNYTQPEASLMHNIDQHEICQESNTPENLRHQPPGGGVDSTDEHRYNRMDRTSNTARASGQGTSGGETTATSEGDKPSCKDLLKNIRGGSDDRPMLPWGDPHPSQEWVNRLHRDLSLTRETPSQYCFRLLNELALSAHYHQNMQHSQDETALEESFQTFLRTRSELRAMAERHQTRNVIHIITQHRQMEQELQGSTLHQQNLHDWILRFRRLAQRGSIKWVKPMPVLEQLSSFNSRHRLSEHVHFIFHRFFVSLACLRSTHVLTVHSWYANASATPAQSTALQILFDRYKGRKRL